MLRPLLQDFFRTLMWWILPCFAVKVTREIFRFSHMFHESIWRSCAVLFASITSWMYLTTIILSSCMLFNLVCNLQVIHFDDYSKVLEQDADPLVYLKEHLQLRHNLSKISHRFRMFLLLLFLSVTASQFAILYKTTAYIGPINFTNGGDIAVSIGLLVESKFSSYASPSTYGVKRSDHKYSCFYAAGVFSCSSCWSRPLFTRSS